jgi:hypothetical protein
MDSLSIYDESNLYIKFTINFVVTSHTSLSVIEKQVNCDGKLQRKSSCLLHNQ